MLKYLAILGLLVLLLATPFNPGLHEIFVDRTVKYDSAFSTIKTIYDSKARGIAYGHIVVTGHADSCHVLLLCEYGNYAKSGARVWADNRDTVYLINGPIDSLRYTPVRGADFCRYILKRNGDCSDYYTKTDFYVEMK